MPRSLLFLALALSACAATSKLAAPAFEPLRFEAPPPAPEILTENHFQRDKGSAISEEDLKTILAAPVFLESHARIGVVPVASRYEVDDGLPVTGVPAQLSEALEGSGMFELSSEVSTDFPIDKGTIGLRELAARYRTEYLLFYRHRFTQDERANGLAWTYATGIGALFMPGNQLEAKGVLEATLFDVKTGTILFTIFERVEGSESSNVWYHDVKLDALKRRLLEQAQSRLADQVIGKCRRLVASRPKDVAPVTMAP